MPDERIGSGATPAPPRAAASTAAIQTTAKWLVGAFAAVGGLIVAGLQLSALATTKDLPISQTLLALTAYAMSATATGVIVLLAARVLLPGFDSIDPIRERETKADIAAAAAADGRSPRLAAEFDPLLLYLHRFRNATSRSGWGDTPGALAVNLDRLNDALANVRAGIAATIDARTWTKEQRADLESEARLAEEDAATIVDLANRYEVERRYKHLRMALAWCGGIVVLAIPIFALAVRPPDRSSDPDPVPISSPIQVLVVIGKDAPVETLGLPPECRGGTLSGAAVGGTLERPIVVTRTATVTVAGTKEPVICPPARFRVSPPAVVAIPEPTSRPS